MYEYKIELLNFKISGKANMNSVLDNLESDFTHESRNGWEYYGVMPVTTSKSPGCLGVLLGQGPIVTETQAAIFRKKIG